MSGFEVHIRKDGGWVVAATFEDRELAVLEAGRIDSTLRYEGVRVVEELYDEIVGEIIAKTIFRCANANPGGRPIPNSTPAGEDEAEEPEDSGPSSEWSWSRLVSMSRHPEAAAVAGLALVSGLVAGLALISIA